MRRTPIRSSLTLATLAALGFCWSRPTSAGPATYDPQPRAFRMTYTFASVPTQYVLDDARSMTAAPEQEAIMRSLLADASDMLSTITDQRARIGPLDFVDTFKEADLVISLTGRPVSPAWTNIGTIEGAPGHCVFYYNSLLDQINANRQDAVATIVHNLCHYIFELADEYNTADFPGGCPDQAGEPGCLMDNYLSAGPRGGWLGRLCDETNHNVQPKQRKSCQALVDEFFAARGAPPKVVDREAEGFRQAKQEAVAQVRDYARGQLEGKTTLAVNTADLQARTQALLRGSLEERKLSRSPEEVERAAREIVGSIVGSLKPEDPGRIEPRLDQRLRSKAAELAARYPRDRHARSTRLALIRKPLLELALEALGKTLEPEECQHIESIVQQAVPVEAF